MRDEDTGNCSSDVKIRENHPVEDYIKNSMMSICEYELDEFDKKILSSVAVDIDADTGEVHTKYQWLKIGKIIMEEAAKSARTHSIPSINPIKSIREGKATRRRTKALREFYREYIQSGEYQKELVKACQKKDDPDKVCEAIIDYLKMLRSDLERRMR